MSRDVVVAKRYAKALFELAQEQKAVSEIESQLELIVHLFETEQDFGQFLGYPGISADKKIEALQAALQDKVSPTLLHTLELLIIRGRHDIITHLYEAFIKIAGEALGQSHATVYTAKSMSDEELAHLSEQFSKLTGKTIISKQIIEPALLGGVQVRIGDRLYDGSLSGKLDRLQKSLKI